MLHAYHKGRAAAELKEGQKAHDVQHEKLSRVGAYGKAHAEASTPAAATK